LASGNDKTDENMEKVKNLVRIDRYLGIRMKAEELNVDKEATKLILTTNWNMTKMCAKWSQIIRQFLAKNKYQPSNTLRTHHILPYVTFYFLNLENFA
jgi:hypothetical protein